MLLLTNSYATERFVTSDEKVEASHGVPCPVHFSIHSRLASRIVLSLVRVRKDVAA